MATGKSVPPTSARKSVPPKAAAKTRTAEELVSELTDLMTDLHFLSDTFEGIDFITSLLKDKLASELIVLSFYDAEKKEFVVVRQVGGKVDKLLSRTSEKAGLFASVVRGGKALVITDAKHDPRAVDPRWKAFGVEPRSLAVAPLVYAGKTLGAIEMANPEGGGGRYATTEGAGISYIAQQLAEFLSNKGLDFDSDRITTAAKKASR